MIAAPQSCPGTCRRTHLCAEASQGLSWILSMTFVAWGSGLAVRNTLLVASLLLRWGTQSKFRTLETRRSGGHHVKYPIIKFSSCKSRATMLPENIKSRVEGPPENKLCMTDDAFAQGTVLLSSWGGANWEWNRDIYLYDLKKCFFLLWSLFFFELTCTFRKWKFFLVKLTKVWFLEKQNVYLF